MGSAATGVPPPNTRIRLYHLTSSSHALSNIENGRMKLARLTDVNDPFELMALNFREARVRQLVGEFRTTFNSQTGLLCFSEDWTSPVMWSHYAMRHRGICLGFDIPRSEVQKVEYRDKRILSSLGDAGDPLDLSPELQTLLMCTKCHEWSYEQERRRFVDLAVATQEADLHFVPFDDLLRLAEVILGPNCEEPLHSVRHLCSVRYPLARVFSARLAWKHFKVVPKESSVP